MSRPALVARVALFSAIVYVLAWGTVYLPNINFVFFIIFSAGFLWGAVPGIIVGACGMGLWTFFNPFGPAPVPIMLSQVVGAAGSGAVGAVFRRGRMHQGAHAAVLMRLLGAAVACTLLFFIPVNTVDAVLFQPFWPRFIGGAVWALVSLGFNLLIFPLLFAATRYLYARECNA